MIECRRDDAPARSNEIRVTFQGQAKGYINYALVLFEDRGARAVALKAMGRAIHKAVAVAEILKRYVLSCLHPPTHPPTHPHPIHAPIQTYGHGQDPQLVRFLVLPLASFPPTHPPTHPPAPTQKGGCPASTPGPKSAPCRSKRSGCHWKKAWIGWSLCATSPRCSSH